MRVLKLDILQTLNGLILGQVAYLICVLVSSSVTGNVERIQ